MGLLEKRLKGNGGRFSEKAEELRERRGVFLRILEKPQKFQAVGFQLCENTAILSLIAVVSIAATDDETAVVSISFFHHMKNKKGRKRFPYTGSLSSPLSNHLVWAGPGCFHPGLIIHPGLITLVAL